MTATASETRGGAEQPVGVDVVGQRTGGEPHRQQHDQCRDAQQARHHLRGDREQHEQAHAHEDLIGRHCSTLQRITLERSAHAREPDADIFAAERRVAWPTRADRRGLHPAGPTRG